MLVPMLRRLPRRIDRPGGALEDGRLTVSIRLLADPSDRRCLTGLVHRVLLTFLAAAAGIMAVLMIGLHGGPALSKSVSLYSFFGYCLLVIAAILAVRVLVQVFRPDPGERYEPEAIANTCRRHRHATCGQYALPEESGRCSFQALRVDREDVDSVPGPASPLPAVPAWFWPGAGVGSGAWVRPDLRIGRRRSGCLEIDLSAGPSSWHPPALPV
jgi:hypothetical protein